MPYGFRNHASGVHEAVEALEKYFSRQGLEVKVLGHGRRFIRAEVYDGEEMVDSILFDRMTGKMRSVY
jgi:hypothetical protein